MPVEHARVGGHVIAYRDVGRGDVVVLLHDDGGGMGDWAETVPKLSEDHRVICLDARSMHTMAEDAIDVLDWVGVSQATFLGRGKGYAVATQLAELHPERVAAALDIDGDLPEGIKPS